MRVNFNISLKEMISWENVNLKNVSREGFKTSSDPNRGKIWDYQKSTIFQAQAQRDTFRYIYR